MKSGAFFNDKKYLVYDFTGINYAFNTADVSITPIEHQEQTGRCMGTFVVEDGIVKKLTIRGTDCQLYQTQQ